MVRPKEDEDEVLITRPAGLEVFHKPIVPDGWGTDFMPWPPRGLDDWLTWAAARPEQTWMINNLLPSDAAVLISGQAKRAYKTWFAFEIAIALALGRSPVSLLTPVCQADSLVIELEGPVKQTEARWRMLVAPYGEQVGDHIKYMHRYNFRLDNAMHLQVVCELLQREKRRLVIIDTLAKAHGGDENSVKDVSETMRHIDQLRKAMPGGTVIFIHHLRKPADTRFISRHDGPTDAPDIDSDIRGSSALAGFYDTHLAIRMANPHQTWLDLTVRSSDAEEKYYQLSWSIDDEVGHTAILDMKELSTDTISEIEAERCIGLLPYDEAYTVNELADIWQINVEVAKAYRGYLLDDGRLKKVNKAGKVQRVKEVGDAETDGAE